MPYYAENPTWKILHAHIDAHSQKLIHEYPGYGVEAITILKYQCENITLSYQIIYNIIFQNAIQKVGESEMNYIKIFKNAKALAI